MRKYAFQCLHNAMTTCLLVMGYGVIVTRPPTFFTSSWLAQGSQNNKASLFLVILPSMCFLDFISRLTSEWTSESALLYVGYLKTFWFNGKWCHLCRIGLHILRTDLLERALCFNASFPLLFLSEPQQHIEDRSFSRMLLPNSSVSREVSGSRRDNTEITLCGRSMCIYYTFRHIFIFKLTPICWGTHAPSPLLITLHHIHRLSEYGWNNLVDMLLLHDSGNAAIPGSLFCLMMQPEPKIFGCPILPA